MSFLINGIEIQYILTGAYARLMDMYFEYINEYGYAKTVDVDRENEMIALFTYLMSARHNSSSQEMIDDPVFQRVVNNLYSQFSLDQYQSPIINGVD